MFEMLLLWIVLIVAIVVSFLIAVPIIVIRRKARRDHGDRADNVDCTEDRRFSRMWRKYDTIHVCYPGCVKLKSMLIKSMSSIVALNSSVVFYILNNNEYTKDDVNEIVRSLDAVVATVNSKHNSSSDNSKQTAVSYKLFVIDVSPWMTIFEDLNSLKGSHNCYVRILIPRLFQNHFPDVKRVLYLDEDTYCNGSLRRLYNYPMCKTFACCIDWNHYLRDEDVTNRDIAEGWLPKTNYVCTGIMLMKTNFDMLQEAFIKTINLYKMISIYSLTVTTHDQFIYNVYGVSIIGKYHKSINYTGDKHEVYGVLSQHYLTRYGILHDWYMKLSDFDRLRNLGISIKPYAELI